MSKVHHQSNRLRTFVTYHLPAIICAAAIIVVSSIPKLQTPNLRVPALDKLAHFVEYAVFAILTFRSFSHITRKITVNRTFLFSALFLTFFALLDEIHQYFVPGRYSDIYDLAMDVLGTLVALVYLRVRVRSAKEISP